MSALCGPGQAEIGGVDQGLAVREDQPIDERHVAGLLASPAVGHPSRAATEVEIPEGGIGCVEDGDVVVSLIGEDPELGGEVGVQVAVAIEVVGRDVEQDPALRGEQLGVGELEARAFADDRRIVGDRARQRRDRGADVARHRNRLAGGTPDVAEELGDGRLAVRPGHGDETARHQPPGELELAENRPPPPARRRERGRAIGHSRALDNAAGGFDQLDSIGIQVNFDARLAQPFRPLGRGRVAADDLLAGGRQHARYGLARSGEPEDQVRPAGKRRSRFRHPIEFW